MINLESFEVHRKKDLFWAAQHGDSVLLLDFIRNGARTQINARSSQGRTPLYLAAENGHADVVRLLLDSGATVLARSVGDRTPLHAAATPEIVHELVARGANVTDKDKLGCMPLHVAAYEGPLDVLQALMSHGAVTHATNQLGWTSLHMAATGNKLDTVKALLEIVDDIQLDAQNNEGCSALGLAVGDGHVEVAECLLLAGADVNAKAVKHQVRAGLMQDAVLHCAVRKGNVAMVQLLLLNRADIHASSFMGRSVMHMICSPEMEEREIQCQLVQMLVAHGANVNAKDDEGSTPLMCALFGDRPELVSLLLSCGADVAARSHQGCTALFFAASNMHSMWSKNGVSVDNCKGEASLQTVAELIQHGADVKAAMDTGMTPLHFAAFGQRTDKAELLLSHGADVNARDLDGFVPLHIACSYSGWRVSPSGQLFVSNSQEGSESSDMVKLFLSQGADANIITLEVVLVALQGEEPLQEALYFNKRLQKVQLLLHHGADASNKSIKGQTALHTAAGWGCPGSVSLLLQHGADPQARFKGENCLQYAAQGLRLEVVKRSVCASEKPSGDMLGCNAAGLDAELARFAALLLELLLRGFDMEAQSSQGKTALHIAVDKGHSELVEILLSHGVKVDVVDLQGRTPLHTAAAQGQPEALRLLLRHGADIAAMDNTGKRALHHAAAAGSFAKLHLKHNEDVIAKTVDPQGFNYLLVSVECIKNTECVQILMDHGADLATVDQAGMTPGGAAQGSAAHVITMLGGKVDSETQTGAVARA